MDRVYEFNLMSGLTLNPNRRWRHVATLFRIGHRKIVLHGIFAIMYFYFIAYQRGKLDCRKQFKFQLPYKYTSKAGIGLFSLSLSLSAREYKQSRLRSPTMCRKRTTGFKTSLKSNVLQHATFLLTYHFHGWPDTIR